MPKISVGRDEERQEKTASCQSQILGQIDVVFSSQDPSIAGQKMRYFIFYPPRQCIRQIDVDENIRVEEVLELVKAEFGLQINHNSAAETSVVLNYNGCDLKLKWTLGELAIPSGAILRCFHRQQQAANLYILCGFNKQILKLFDSTITLETTIGTLRKQIANQLGLPLSIFCLETLHGTRLYDEMKLINYDVKLHDHIYLRVWREHEKFVNACVKGFSEHHSSDDLTRHYQAQVALHIAAFYGKHANQSREREA